MPQLLFAGGRITGRGFRKSRKALGFLPVILGLPFAWRCALGVMTYNAEAHTTEASAGARHLAREPSAEGAGCP